MMQPAFVPWQGYFELALRADRFVLLDDFQFSVQSWHQRNRLFSSPGVVDWYTVPVLHASFGKPLNETLVDESKPWRQKLWKRILQSYSKAPCFPSIGPAIQQWLCRATPSLGHMNIEFTMLVLRMMGADTEVMRSSELGGDGQRSGRVLELLVRCEASRYLCAGGSFEYMREDRVFPVAEPEVLFQDFIPRPYPQVGSPVEFVPQLSIVDALMNVGPDATRELVLSGTARWLPWSEMVGAEDVGGSRG